MKKRFTSSLALFFISGMVFFVVSALILKIELSNLEFASPKQSRAQPQASSTETNQVEKAQAQLTGPSWEYRNPKIGDLTTELNARLRALDEKENELEQRETLVKQTEKSLEALKQELIQLKDDIQAKIPQESTNTLDAASIKLYTDMFNTLEPSVITQILDTKTPKEIGQIWASLKPAVVGQLVQYWQKERPDKADDLKSIMDAYEAQAITP